MMAGNKIFVLDDLGNIASPAWIKDNPEKVQNQKDEHWRKNFDNPELILNIHAEIDKRHLLDHKEKLSSFINCATAYLNPPELHKSGAYKGDSSVGKDNLIKSVLALFPEEDWIFLTNATSSVMEDDIARYKILAYSEMNANRDDGANCHLIEILKQVTEGGTSSMKKDLKTGYRTTKHIIQEQKTVLYGTTESESDEELGTRFIIYGVLGHPTKTKKVNENTLNWFAGSIKCESDGWIAEGIRKFDFRNVRIPYAPFLKGAINGRDIFDCSNPRSMRDVKRIMAHASAVTWLYQDQRKISNGYIISEIFDFLLVVLVSGDFFNQTYEGLGDVRLKNVLQVMKDFEIKRNVELVPRKEIQKALGVTRNTIKGYLNGLNNLSMVSFVEKDGNNLLYKRCQEGIKKPLIGVSFNELKEYLEECQGVKIRKEYCTILEKLQNMLENEEKTVPSEKIDTLKLTPLVENIKDGDLINHKCHICGDQSCIDWDTNAQGRPICDSCKRAKEAQKC